MCTESIASNCMNSFYFCAYLVRRIFKGALEFCPQCCILPNGASATCRILSFVHLAQNSTLLGKCLIVEKIWICNEQLPAMIFFGVSSNSMSMSNEKIDWRNDLLVILARIHHGKKSISLTQSVLTLHFNQTETHQKMYTQNMIFSLFSAFMFF